MNYRLLLVLCTLVTTSLSFNSQADEAQCAPWLDHKVGQLHSGNTLDLCEITAGKPVLLVNTASHCGFTKQFKGLEALHQKYKDQGLVVIGFSSDSFNQEAENSEEIADVCYKNYGVSFYMTDTIAVRGDDAHPIFQHLSDAQTSPKWNFYKYLVNRQGEVVDYFSQWRSPDGDAIQEAVSRVVTPTEGI